MSPTNLSLLDTPETFAAAWQAEAQQQSVREVSWFAAFGRKAITLGLSTLAIDILRAGLSESPNHRELLYLQAMALARSGSLGSARRELGKFLPTLPADNALYVDAASLAGRVAKDAWSRLPEGKARAAAGEEARTLYLKAYQKSQDYFPGINAATMCMLTGRADVARKIAKKVRASCLSAVAKSRSKSSGYWLHATLGEAHLLLGEFEAAKKQYAAASRLAGKRYGDIASMRRQLKLLARQIPEAAEMLHELALPSVVAFVGHMIDEPGREDPRFPPHAAPAVAAAITRELDRLSAGFGFVSAACGADIIFAEQMLRRGAELTVVLPFRRDDFKATSVAFAGESWVKRFESVLAKATSVVYAIDENYFGDDCLFDYASRLIYGMSLLRARQIEADDALLAVLDPSSKSKIGGTRASVAQWQAQGRDTSVIDLRKIRQALKNPVSRRTANSNAKSASALRIDARPETWGRRKIKTLLFSDMVGFSKLGEEHAPSFIVGFLGEIAKQIAKSKVQPEFVNTWGDGLFMVFDDAVVAAEFVLRLRDAITGTDWAAAGLPAGISIRVGMHTGPVFPAQDPIILKTNFFGSHVNRAARIEPIAAPASVFLTEQSASMLAAAGANEFACDYMGTLALAKHFGDSRLYRLRRRHEVE